jgi:hypothetical protein
MIDIEEKFRERLKKEARQWVEDELARRMEHARAEIRRQVEIASESCGEERARKRMADAIAYAEEEIHKELENEAWVRVEEQMRVRREKVKGKTKE